MNKNLLYVVLFLVLAFTAFYFYHRTNTAPSLQLQQFEVSDLNAQPFNWNSLKGTKTLICFGASWCVDCRKELQSLKKLSQNELQSIQIIVISDESYDKIRSYKQKQDYPFLFLKLQKSFSEYGIYSIPTNYLLNKNLQVVKEKTGDFNWEDASNREHLLTLMGH